MKKRYIRVIESIILMLENDLKSETLSKYEKEGIKDTLSNTRYQLKILKS